MIETPVQPSVWGRLAKCVDFWRFSEVSQFILNVICEAYKIPFFLLPTPFSKANNASARANSGFVTQAVNDLLQSDLIEEIFSARASLIRFLFPLAVRGNCEWNQL